MLQLVSHFINFLMARLVALAEILVVFQTTLILILVSIQVDEHKLLLKITRLTGTGEMQWMVGIKGKLIIARIGKWIKTPKAITSKANLEACPILMVKITMTWSLTMMGLLVMMTFMAPLVRFFNPLVNCKLINL
jgi:hypothetical protein